MTEHGSVVDRSVERCVRGIDMVILHCPAEDRASGFPEDPAGDIGPGKRTLCFSRYVSCL